MQIFSSKSNILKIIDRLMCFRKGTRVNIHPSLACLAPESYEQARGGQPGGYSVR